MFISLYFLYATLRIRCYGRRRINLSVARDAHWGRERNKAGSGRDASLLRNSAGYLSFSQVLELLQQQRIDKDKEVIKSPRRLSCPPLQLENHTVQQAVCSL